MMEVVSLYSLQITFISSSVEYKSYPIIFLVVLQLVSDTGSTTKCNSVLLAVMYDTRFPFSVIQI